MVNTERNARFYSPFPLEGVQLHKQWANLRVNHEETKAIVRHSLLDVNTDKDYYQQERALRGHQYGQWDASQKFQWVYSATDSKFRLQRNDGTQAAPSWTDLIIANSSGGITYVSPTISGDLNLNGNDILNVHNINTGLINSENWQPRFEVTDSNLDNVFYLVRRITFDREAGFYVTPDSNGEPVVSANVQFGKAQKFSFTSAATEWVANHSFGVKPQVVEVYDDADRVVTADTVDVSGPNVAYFYFKTAMAGHAVISTGGIGAQELRPLLTIRGITGGAVMTEYTNADQLNFSDNDFYLSNRATGKKPVVNLKHLVEDESGNVSIVTNPMSATFDTLGNTTIHGDLKVEGRFEGGKFYLNDLSDVNAPGPSDNQILSYDSATGKWIPAGSAAGVTDHGALTGLNPDNDHPQYLLVTDIDDTAVNGEIAQPISSNWAFDHINDADQHTEYIQADGTRAFTGEQSMGTNKLTNVVDPTANQDAATKKYVDDNAGSGGGGFYGVIFKESEVGGTVMRDDTLVVDSQSFYLTGRPDGKPLLSMLRPTTDGIQNINKLNDGAFAPGQSISMTVLESAGNIVFYPIASTGSSVVVQFQGTNYTWTPVAKVLTAAAADTAPVERFVYLTRSGSTITIDEGGSWPAATEHARIATVVVQTASGVASNGALKIHAWTDHVHENLTSGDTTRGNRGHLHALSEKFRSQHADWSSGMVVTLPQSGTDLDIDVTAGTGFQLHKHTTPAFNTNAGGDSVYVVNDPDTPYNKLGVLTAANLPKYSDGSAIGTSNRFCVVIWAVISENASDSKLFLNLPSAGYNSDAGAWADGSNTANYTVPSAYRGTALLLGRAVFKLTGGGGTLNNINETAGSSHDPAIHADLRGTPPTVFAGGSATGSGEANTASNLGATVGAEGVWFQKAGLDLEFKSLVGGTDIGLSSDNDEITITNEAGPGFYGVIFKESESGGAVMRDDALVFDSSRFYLSGRPDGKPLLAAKDRIGPLAEADMSLSVVTNTWKMSSLGSSTVLDKYVFSGNSSTAELVVEQKSSGDIVKFQNQGSGVKSIQWTGSDTHFNIVPPSSTSHVGINKATPEYKFHVGGDLKADKNIHVGSAFYGPIMQPKQYLSGETALGGNIHDVNMDWTQNSTFFMPVSRSYTMHTPILGPSSATSASDAQTVHLVTKNMGFYNLMWSRKYIFPGGDQTPISKGENVVDKWTLTYIPSLDKVIVVKDANCFY